MLYEMGASDYIICVWENIGGCFGDWWNFDGTYGGTFDVNSSSVELNMVIVLMVGGYFGGNYL